MAASLKGSELSDGLRFTVVVLLLGVAAAAGWAAALLTPPGGTRGARERRPAMA